MKEHMEQLIRIAVCDDDETIRTQIAEFAQTLSSEKNIPLNLSLFPSGDELLNADTNLFDVLFLDIQMPGINGMDTARTIRASNRELRIVFVTNYEQYAIEGYEVQALRFLKKPIEYKQFIDVVGKTIASIHKDRDFVSIKTREGVHHVRTSHILYAETYRRHVLIHTTSGEIECNQSMNSVEQQLGISFFRCHTAYLVNLKHLEQIHTADAILTDQTIIPVSKHRRTAFLQATMEYWGDVLL